MNFVARGALAKCRSTPESLAHLMYHSTWAEESLRDRLFLSLEGDQLFLSLLRQLGVDHVVLGEVAKSSEDRVGDRLSKVLDIRVEPYGYHSLNAPAGVQHNIYI